MEATGAAGAGDSRHGMASRLTSRGVRRGVLVVVSLVLVYLGGLFVLSRFLDSARLADWLQPRLTSLLRRPVDIGSAEVALRPFGFRLTEIEVGDPTGLTPRLAHVEEVALRVRLLPLLRREVIVDRIVVGAPSLSLYVGADGAANWATPPDTLAAVTSAAERPITLELRSVDVSDGQATYRSEPDSSSGVVSAFETSSSVRRPAGGSWTFGGRAAGSVSASSPAMPALEAVPLELIYDLDALADFGAVTIRDGELRLDRIRFSLEGELAGLRGTPRTVDVTATLDDLPLERAAAALPDSLRTRLGPMSGRASARFAVRGQIGEGLRPEVTGRVTLADVGLSTPSGVSLFEGVAADVEREADGSLHPTASGTALGGAFTLAGRVSVDSTRIARLTVEARPELSRLASLDLLPDGATAAGALHAALDLEIPVDDPYAARAFGEVALTDGRFTTALLGAPVGIPRGVFVLDGDRVSARDLAFTLGEERFAATGELRDPAAWAAAGRTPYLEATVTGSRLTVTNLSARVPADTALTYGRIAFARVGGRSVGGTSPEDGARSLGLARPASLPITGRVEVALDTVVDRRGTYEEARAIFELGPTFVRTSEASFRRYGGRVRGGFNLALGGAAAQPFTMRLAAEGVNATPFLSANTPLGRFVRGSLDLDVDLSGTLDELLLPSSTTLVGGGRFRATGAGLQATQLTERVAALLGMPELREPTFRSWTTPFAIRDGSIELAEAALEGAFGAPRVGGEVGFDGRLALIGRVDLPAARLDTTAVARLGRIGAIAVRTIETVGPIQAVVRIGGTVASPEVTGGLAATQAPSRAAQEAVTTEIREQIQERRDELEERARRALQELLRRRRPGGTSRPDTLPRLPG